MNGTITRAALIEAVEAGIASADKVGFLSEPEKIAVRHVARTENTVACGAFMAEDEHGNVCGCPLHLAGVDWQSAESQERNFGHFYSQYDRRTTALARRSVLRVVG